MSPIDAYNNALTIAKAHALATLLAKLELCDDPKILLAVLRLRPLPTPTPRPPTRAEPAAATPPATSPAATPPVPAAPASTAAPAAPIAASAAPAAPDLPAAASPSPRDHTALSHAPSNPPPKLTRQQRRHLAREAAKRQRRSLNEPQGTSPKPFL